MLFFSLGTTGHNGLDPRVPGILRSALVCRVLDSGSHQSVSILSRKGMKEMKTILKTRYVRIACAAMAGVALLTAAVFANYENANGYNVCKNALKNIAFQNNATIQMNMEMKLDEEKIASMERVYRFADSDRPYKQYRSNKSTELNADGSYESYQSESYIGEKDSISIYTNENGTQAYRNEYSEPYGTSSAGILDPNDATTQKLVTFLEKIADTMVGDLKNSFIMTESSGGSHTYEVLLSGAQMPDWVSSGLSLLVSNIKDSTERSRRDMLENPEDYVDYEAGIDEKLYDAMFIGGDPVLDSVSGIMSVDAEGFPTRADGRIIVTGFDGQGQEHRMTISFTLESSDIGTTTIAEVDLGALPLISYDKNGVTTMQIPSGASEETVRQVMEEAKERASYGQSVTVRNADGTETVLSADDGEDK